ncbi:MAG: helix-turn-helix domain-containing protein [Spirochaetaceae bacterium]|nr:helix-turn-helix domain-containing protein [Spirochaetaceae bacterium]
MLWNEYTIQVIIDLSLINDKKEFAKNIRNASLKLQCSERTIYRKLTEYEIIGMKAFLPGNKERTPANKKDLTLIEEFINKYKLQSRNFTSLTRCLRKYEYSYFLRHKNL